MRALIGATTIDEAIGSRSRPVRVESQSEAAARAEGERILSQGLLLFGAFAAGMKGPALSAVGPLYVEKTEPDGSVSRCFKSGGCVPIESAPAEQ
jgi:hypothetical protein